MVECRPLSKTVSFVDRGEEVNEMKGLAGKQTRGIMTGTMLDVIDNSGAKTIICHRRPWLPWREPEAARPPPSATSSSPR